MEERIEELRIKCEKLLKNIGSRGITIEIKNDNGEEFLRTLPDGSHIYSDTIDFRMNGLSFSPEFTEETELFLELFATIVELCDVYKKNSLKIDNHS